MRKTATRLLTLWSLLTFFGSHPAGAAELCPTTQRTTLTRAQTVRVIAKEKGYTEGLIFKDGYLYESLGLPGFSELRKIDPYTGIPKTLRYIDPDYFAEGLAYSNGHMIQLTYKENVAFVYTQEHLTATVPFAGEGWGLTALGGYLIKSDGSAKLSFVDPNFRTQRTITVHDNKRTYARLNELEAARGSILANIFGEDWVAIIDPFSGCVTGKIDLSPLRTAETLDPNEAKCKTPRHCLPGDFATNGIAYDDIKDELYFTGKNWPFIYVFKFPR